MTRLEIDVKKDICLGYSVYRGSIKAKDLAPALWIDFYDEQLNPLGYQRPFNSERSQQAADYANNVPDAFWPESILAIRSNDEVEENQDKVHWNFVSQTPNNDFGKLIVEYNGDRTELIGNEIAQWRRAFSQVDCQHRLGRMNNSDKYVTICIIPGLVRREEALIFKIINDTQKKISTSLVDVIIELQDPASPPEIHWAYDLGRDVGSPFYKKVNSEGRNLTGQKYLVTLRTLRTCISSLLGGKRIIHDLMTDDATVHALLRNYWLTIRNLWPNEFEDTVNFKLMTVPGLKGLVRFSRKICIQALEEGNTNPSFAQTLFQNDPGRMNWSINGPLKEATGNAGARIVYETLCNVFGQP